MGLGAQYPTKASGKDSKSDGFFRNKENLIFLALTVLSLQVADFVLVWLADSGSKSDYWSLSNNWTQVDIFVGVFALFYIGKHLTKQAKEFSCTPTEAEKPDQQEKAFIPKPIPKRQTKGPRPERRVSFNEDVDAVEPVQKTSALRADAPAFQSEVNQGLRASAPVFVPKAAGKVAPPPPPPLPKWNLQEPARMDDDNVGTVLFRSACSAGPEPQKPKPKTRIKEAWQVQPSSWGQDYDPWANQSKDQSWASPEVKTKWIPKEKTIWKSSHMLGA